MTLPFADNPDKSSIYNDLKVEKLVNLEASDFDAFKARMDAQGVDGLEDEYRRLLLLGLSSDKLSVSGPIPGSGNIQISVQTSGSSGNAVLLQPPKGQVWQVMGISATSSATPSESQRFYFFYSNSEPWSSATDASTVFLNSVDSSSTLIGFETLEENVQRPMFVTNELYFAMYSNMVGLSGSETVTWKIAYQRIR